MDKVVKEKIEDSSLTQTHPSLPERLLRFRVILLAIPVLILQIQWTLRAEKMGFGPFFTTLSLFSNCLFGLMLIVGINAILTRVLPRLALSRAELLLLYSMSALGTALAGTDMLPVLITLLGHPYQMSNAGNGWMEHFGRFLPSWLMVSDKEILKGYFLGHSSLYAHGVLAAWVGPVLLWSVFTLILLWTMMCLNILLRQGWQERERLPFPLVEIPMQMTDPSGDLWKNQLFWLGFGLCACIEILNGFHWLYPALPEFSMKQQDLHALGLFPERPWSAIGWTPAGLYPFAIGLGYLLPLDLLFSCWFFYLFWKAQLILSAALAWDVTPDFPFVREQSFGGYAAVFVFLAWNGRHHLNQVWQKIWGEESSVNDNQEALSYRQAATGAGIGFCLLVAFMVWVGMALWVAIAAFLIYFLLSIVIARMRAEFGPPVHDLHFSGPDQLLIRVLGTPAFTPKDLTGLTFFYWFNRAYRAHPMPIQIESLHMTATLKARQRFAFAALLFAGALGTMITFWVFLDLAYTYGTQAKMTWGGLGAAEEAYNRLNHWTTTPTPPNRMATGAIGVGFLFCSLLMLARIQFPWWPFHPIGYAISSSWSMNFFWMPLLIAWALKALILRYGGVKFYRQAMPFFLGLILGQFTVGCLWHLLGLWLGIVPYSFWDG